MQGIVSNIILIDWGQALVKSLFYSQLFKMIVSFQPLGIFWIIFCTEIDTGNF